VYKKFISEQDVLEEYEKFKEQMEATPREET